MSMEKHLTLVAALNIGLSAFALVIGFLVFFLLGGIGAASDDPEALVVLSIVGFVVFAVLFLISIPALIGGIGLLKRRNWARVLLMIISAVNLINVPFGTALGVYTLWVLLQEETQRMFTLSPVPPAPNDPVQPSRVPGGSVAGL
jgi:hypothetical protein